MGISPVGRVLARAKSKVLGTSPYSLMVKRQTFNLLIRVRFPVGAPFGSGVMGNTIGFGPIVESSSLSSRA
jgi:hypothetical protein